LRYGKILLIGSGIGAFASLIGGWALIVTILFPVVWMILENKKEYLTLAIGYYIGVSLEDPWLVKNFLEHFTPHHGIINGSLGVIGTGIAVLLLSLTWVFPNPKTFGEEYRYLTGGLSLLVVMCALPLVPGFELNGYASPLVSAGLLFPGTGYAGIILEILAITGVAYLAKSDLTQTKNRTKNVTILAGILLIPISINVFFAQKSHEKIDAIGKKTLMIIDPSNNASSFLQTNKDIDTGINDHDITVLPEGEIGVLTPQKIMAPDKMNAHALLKKGRHRNGNAGHNKESEGIHYRLGILKSNSSAAPLRDASGGEPPSEEVKGEAEGCERGKGGGSGVGRNEGMPRDGIRQPRPDIARAFSECSGVALDGEEEAGSFLGTEASGDLLAHLDHPEVLFGLVVGEGEGGVEGKGEDLAGVFFEATEEILCGSGVDSSSAFSGKRPAGLDPFPGKEGLEASEDLLSFGLAGWGSAGGSLFLEIEKEGGHLGGPSMAVELGDGRQLPKNMGVAEGMLWGEGGSPEIGDEGSRDMGGHA